MTTFAKPEPLTRQLAIALCALREARKDGDATRIHVASRRFNDKLELLPTPTRTLAETDPELDAWLRVAWK
jgi:hypothetical protein